MTNNSENDSDRQALEEAKEVARRNMNENPTQKNVAAFEALVAALKEKVVVYKNRMAALRKLIRDGYKIGKSKFYQECKLGLCQLQADGSVLEEELNRYVRRVELDKPAEKSADPANDILTRKSEKEIEIQEEKLAKMRREREIDEGRYQERAVVEMELAGKCAVLEAGLRHLFHVRLVDWIETAAAHGLPAALDAAQQDLNTQFNEFASLDVFEVLIGGI